jgi:UDP-N-acetylmuramoylalanine--D-glutamate ligase
LAGDCSTALWFSLSPPQHERAYGIAQWEGQAWLYRGTSPLLPVAAVKLAGRHNLANVLAAWALADALALPQAAICAAVTAFSGLAHRTEWVATQAGITWYNDSKGTNIGATIAALQGMTDPVVLIAGGQGKGADFSLLRSAVTAKARAVVLLGEDAPLLAAALTDTVPLVRVADMQAAVAQAQGLAQAGDCVLLSPACASFDMFRGYEHRGQHYRECVQERLGVNPCFNPRPLRTNLAEVTPLPNSVYPLKGFQPKEL